MPRLLAAAARLPAFGLVPDSEIGGPGHVEVTGQAGYTDPSIPQDHRQVLGDQVNAWGADEGIVSHGNDLGNVSELRMQLRAS
jgi:hypothetical protein